MAIKNHLDGLCKKCGYSTAMITYIPPVTYGSYCGKPLTGGTDHLRRECLQCGFRWKEPCLDVEEK